MAIKISVIGTRGIPATYGGVEKHAEELYSRLVKLGFEVSIYARKYYNPDNIEFFKGVKIINIGVINVKGFETFLHSFISTLKATFSNADVIHFHAQGPALFAFIPKLLTPKKLIMFTCHGIDWKRDKWGFIPALVIKTGEFVSARFTDLKIMVADHLKVYYKNKFNVDSSTVYNGVPILDKVDASNTLKMFKLEKAKYFIFVGRLVPEKAPGVLIEAFKNLETDYKLVIVGDSAGSNDYVKEIKKSAQEDHRIVFTGFQYQENLQELYSNASAFASASKLEGFPITVLEAMSFSLPVLLSDIPPHKELFEVESEIGFIFKVNSVNECKKVLSKFLSLEENTRHCFSVQAQASVKSHFSWDVVAEKTANLVEDAVKEKRNNT